MKKSYLNLAIFLWLAFSVVLLLLLLQPTQVPRESIAVIYAEFLPGKTLQQFVKGVNCSPIEYVETYYGTILYCTVPQHSAYVRGIYVVSLDNEIRSVYFYLKPDTIMVGDLVTWFDHWSEEKRSLRRVYALLWPDMSASITTEWPGLDTEIVSISFK